VQNTRTHAHVHIEEIIAHTRIHSDSIEYSVVHLTTNIHTHQTLLNQQSENLVFNVASLAAIVQSEDVWRRGRQSVCVCVCVCVRGGDRQSQPWR